MNHRWLEILPILVLDNNYSVCFHLGKFWTNLVRFDLIEFGVGLNHIVFSSILLSFGLTQYVFVRSCIDFLKSVHLALIL